MARSVLMRGALTHRAALLPPKLAPVREAAERLATLGLPLPELAYRYVLSQQGPITALVGTGRIDELEAACRYTDPLDPAILEAARAVDIADPALLDISTWG